MLRVVTNTTPLLSFIKLGKLDLLQTIYGEIIVPNAVYQEIENGKDGPYYVNLKTLPWIKIVSVQSESRTLMVFDLDAGETEVLLVA